MTPDPLMASARASSPQTWNRYSYVLNNPLRFVDPRGLNELNAEQCKKDPHCVTLNVNVVYDQNANGGKGLTDQQKKTFEHQQLQDAKDEYGSADIHLNVTYSSGAVSDNSLTGLVSGAVNVLVSDHTMSGEAGDSGRTTAGGFFSMLNINRVGNDTLSHELAHHVFGDTSFGFNNAMLRGASAIDPSLGLVVGLPLNLFADVGNDQARNLAQSFTRGPGGCRYGRKGNRT